MIANANMSMTCERCGRTFHVKPSRMKRYNTRFCSLTCRSISFDPEHFWERVDIRRSDECWHWKGGGHVREYGRLTFEGVWRQAHHVAFKLTFGDWPPYLRHSCDNPSCCNPAHLLAGTHDDNMADKVERDRQTRGEASVHAKLTEDQVRAIRADTRKHEDIAADYGVDSSHISRVKTGKAWRCVK